MLSVTIKSIMLSAVILCVVMMNVMAPKLSTILPVCVVHNYTKIFIEMYGIIKRKLCAKGSTLFKYSNKISSNIQSKMLKNIADQIMLWSICLGFIWVELV